MFYSLACPFHRPNMAAQKEYYGHCIKGKLPWGMKLNFLTKHDNKHPDALVFNPNISLEKNRWKVGRTSFIFIFYIVVRLRHLLSAPHTINKSHLPAFPKNTIFFGKITPQRSGGQAYVHNGLYWADYGQPI